MNAGLARRRARHWERAARSQPRTGPRSAHRRTGRSLPGRRSSGPVRRWAGRVVLLLAAATVVLVGILVLDLRTAYNRLVSARSLLEQATASAETLATPEGRAAALVSVDEAAAALSAADEDLRASRALSLVRGVPGLSAQRSGLLALTTDAGRVATVTRDLIAEVDGMAARATLVDGAVPIADLRALRSILEAAGGRLAGIELGPRGLWGPLGDARRDFDEAVADGAERLQGAAGALGAAVSFMGAEGDRAYLVAIQNNAEMRAQGMVLSYALVRFERGRLRFDGNGSVIDLAIPRPAPTPLPLGTRAVFGSIQPTQLWMSVNATADFALSGQAMVDMYQMATGERLDGVIALDVPALALVLSVIGPVQIPDIPAPVTAANAADVLLRDSYAGIGRSDRPERREKLGDITKAVIERLTTGSHDGVQLGLRLSQAARGHHLRLWSTQRAEEQVFQRSGLGGGPATSDPDRTFLVNVQNRTSTKLDYYVTTTLRHDVELTAEGDAIVRTTVVIDNQAPSDGRSPYALGPDQYQSRAGEYHAWLLLWAPADSESTVTTVEESGLELSQRVVVVDPGTRREVPLPTTTVRNAVRDGQLDLRFVPQPRLHPTQIEVRLVAQDWRVKGPTRITAPLDRVLHASWTVSR